MFLKQQQQQQQKFSSQKKYNSVHNLHGFLFWNTKGKVLKNFLYLKNMYFETFKFSKGQKHFY